MAARGPDAAVRATGDSEPLLADSENSLLRRVVGGLQPRRTWRRWFSRDAAEAGADAVRMSEGSQTDGERDIESGEPLARAGQPRDVRSGVGSSSTAAAQLDDAASTAITPHSRGSAAQPAAERSDSSEITAAPLEAAEAGEAGGAAAAPADQADAAATASGLTLGERVASLGHLLGLGSKSASDRDGEGGGKPGTGGLKRFLSGSGGSGDSGERGLSRSSSGSQPMCLICLDPLTSEDFLSGEAISLDCQCRGDLALRHKACAIKWSRVKGDAVCDICKSQVANLPTPSPRASTPSGSDAEITIEDYAAHGGIPLGMDAVPGNADMLFDCIRVTWVFMIICILFFEMNLSTALWSGIIAGIGYTLFVRAMYRQQLQAAAAEAARIAAGGATPPPRAPPPPMLHHVVG